MAQIMEYYTIKDSTLELVKVWLIQNYKYEVTPAIVGIVSAEAEDSAMNVGVDCASVELSARETKRGVPCVYTFNAADFIVTAV